MLLNVGVLLVTILSVQGLEPECSRFHYEEQTLEKMIRQELRVDKLEAKMEETKEQVELSLKTLQRERESFKTEIEEVKKTYDLEQEKHVRLEEMHENASLHAVAFRATSIQRSNPNNGETLIFRHTVFDIGNGYNNQTGLFTAPYSGIYLFTLHLCFNYADSYMFYEFFTQTRTLFTGKFVSSKYWSCRSSQFLDVVQSKETVGVKMKSSSVTSGSVIHDTPGVADNVFSGVLVKFYV